MPSPKKRSKPEEPAAKRVRFTGQGNSNSSGNAGAGPERHDSPMECNQPKPKPKPKSTAAAATVSAATAATETATPATAKADKTSPKKKASASASPKEAPPLPITPEEETESIRDIQFMERLNQLRADTEEFCRYYYQFDITGNKQSVFKLFVRGASDALVSYAGYISMGGPNGDSGWEELLSQPKLRQCLVAGIISRALTEKVLNSQYFGASEELTAELSAMEHAMVDEDGFTRAATRASIIASDTRSSRRANLALASAHVAAQLAYLISPIRNLNNKGGPLLEARPDVLSAFVQALRRLVDSAAVLNHMLREFGADVVYHFPAVFKDEEFDPRRMRCQNLADMQRACPLAVCDEQGREMALNDLDGDPEHVALVRVVCWPGCVAYRRGGGDMGKRQLREDEALKGGREVPEGCRKKRKLEVSGRVIGEGDGFRAKTLARAGVALRWGYPRAEGQQGDEYVELVETVAKMRQEEAERLYCAVM